MRFVGGAAGRSGDHADRSRLERTGCDRHWHVVEILGLEDPEKKEAVPLQDVLIIVKGAQGLRDDDTVKLEEEEEGPEK